MPTFVKELREEAIRDEKKVINDRLSAIKKRLTEVEKLLSDKLQVPDEPWRPKEGEWYYYPLTSNGIANSDYKAFHSIYINDQDRLAAGMCFKTEAEALAAAQKMLDAIKPNQL